MKHAMKRFLSIALVCVMLFGMLPVSAFAEGTESEETNIVLTEPQEVVVEETTALETTAPETTVPEETAAETTSPETTVPEETVAETTIPETAVPEETVPEDTVPEETVAENPVQDLYDTLMAFETYEALGDYMDNMTDEQYELLSQFSDDQNVALTAKIAELQETDGEVLAPSSDSHTFTHLDVRIQNVPLTMTRKTINMVTGAVVSTSTSTITANLTKVEYVTINGVTYNQFYKMDAREWRQSNVQINLSSLTSSSTAVLVVDLVDSTGKTYNDVRITYNRDGIQYAIEHCDGYKGGTNYDGIDFDPSESGNNITIIEYDDYVIPVMKIWDDANDQDGKRPESVTIKLYADGELNDSAVLNAANNWQYIFEGKASHDSEGNAITYSIDEAAVPTGYTKLVGNNGIYLTVTNSHIPETTSVSGIKTWVDNDNQDGIRPTSITINLLADGVEVDSQTVTKGEDGTWAWSFTDLDKYKAGKEIEYTVEEEAVEGYTATYAEDSYNITNTHTPETIDLTVEKSWDDNNDQDGKRPDEITVKLLADGEEVKSVTVTAKAGWKYEFKGLPKYAAGKEIKYTVEEVPVEGYESSVNGMLITNTHTPEKTKVSVEKVWDDADNQDGIRPADITVKLLADGVDTGKTLVLDADNSWTGSFTDLDVYAAGESIDYTVAEVEVTGYESVVTGSQATGYTITNTHTPAVVEVAGSKAWNDNNNQDGKRPDSITIRLKANGTEVAVQTVTPDADGNWTWNFKNLDKYANGAEITYTITEDAVAEYESLVDGFNVTNTHEIEKTSVSGTKTWVDNDDQDGKRPDSITIRLKANGTEVAVQTVTPDADGNWTWSFENLDKYANGAEITYTITEDAVAEYESLVDGFNVTNTHEIEKTSVSGTKTWVDNDDQDGKRPNSITIRLKANGTEVAAQTVTPDADGNWAWNFEDLDKYANGAEITYTITEDAVAEYESSVDGFNVTNTHEIIKTSVSITKTWDDNNDQDGKRPDAITIRLKANGEVIRVASVIPDENGVWAYTFEGLDKYANGTEIAYTITEDAVPEYTTEIDGFAVTNTHEIEKTSVSGVKTWVDDNDRDGLRPESITINLVADGEIIKTAEVTEADGWAWSFTELPKYRDHGTEIVYEITEEAVEGYESVIEDFNAVNTHEIETVSVEGVKTWDDDNDRDGIRPESIIVNLLADGEIIDTIEVTEADGWAWSFTELPKYRDHGIEIVYSVDEEAVEGYETAIDGFNVTNTHAIETVSVEGAKTWNDANNQDGKRPESIIINLVADGEIIETIEVTEAEGWAWSFTDLPKYKDQGVEIVYAITENAVEGYSTTYDGYNVINSYTPEEISITVTKAWADSNNAEGIRPGSVTIRLLANGVFTGLTLELDAQGKWVGSFTGLPKYFEGVQVEYTVDEVKVKGYTTVIKGSMEEGYTVTNTHVYIPQTGDDRTPIMWMSVMAVSCLMIVLVTIDTKRRRAAK